MTNAQQIYDELDDNQKQALEEVHRVWALGMQEMLKKSDPAKSEAGWIYKDVHWCSYSVWDELFALIGEGNYSILAMSKTDKAIRGQMFVYPQGIANVQEYNKKIK